MKLAILTFVFAALLLPANAGAEKKEGVVATGYCDSDKFKFYAGTGEPDKDYFLYNGAEPRTLVVCSTGDYPSYFELGAGNQTRRVPVHADRCIIVNTTSLRVENVKGKEAEGCFQIVPE
ncbi:hypothetical protein [Hoeflea poritis]|uniref:Uncharacterized protein n=1 Tax=Hoeflea poritis TaxID=2993659 RepID=A0ABT4VTT4_9HYPH|nr:hypothetical protein [Hoeflea poritis]MDA4848019.1 hypothetical protein [Hoeflea poritis]